MRAAGGAASSRSIPRTPKSAKNTKNRECAYVFLIMHDELRPLVSYLFLCGRVFSYSDVAYLCVRFEMCFLPALAAQLATFSSFT